MLVTRGTSGKKWNGPCLMSNPRVDNFFIVDRNTRNLGTEINQEISRDSLQGDISRSFSSRNLFLLAPNVWRRNCLGGVDICMSSVFSVIKNQKNLLICFCVKVSGRWYLRL